MWVEHAVAAAEHEPVGHLVGAAHARRPVTMLVEVQRVHHFSWSRPQHRSARIEVEAQRAAHAVDVLRHLTVVVPEPEVQREAGRDLAVLLDKETASAVARAHEVDYPGRSGGAR